MRVTVLIVRLINLSVIASVWDLQETDTKRELDLHAREGSGQGAREGIGSFQIEVPV